MKQISEALRGMMNDQIMHEFGASRHYLAIACMLNAKALKLTSSYFRKQSDEERGHAEKFIDYLLDIGAKVELKALPAAKTDFATPAEAIRSALEAEIRVTEQIHAMVAQAEQDKDYASRKFLDWFVEEQIEEVSTMSDLVQIAEMCGPHVLQLEAYMLHMSRAG